MDQEADKVESDTKDSQDLELATPPRPKRRSPYATPGNHHSRWKPRRNTAQNRPDANPGTYCINYYAPNRCRGILIPFTGPSRSRNLAAKYKGYPAMLLDRISAIMAAIYCATNANSRTTTVSLKSIHRSHHEIKLTSTLTSVGARDALIPRKLLDNVAGVIYCFSGFLLDAIDKGVGVLSAYPDATSASYKRLARDSVHPMTDEIRNEMWIRISAVTNSLIKKWTSCLKTSRSNGIMCATEYASASCTPVVPCLDDWVDNPIWNLHHGPGSGVEQLWDDVMTETCPQHLSALARTQVTHDDFKQVARPVIKYVLSQLLRGKILTGHKLQSKNEIIQNSKPKPA